jgi:hypothetical protein
MGMIFTDGPSILVGWVEDHDRGAEARELEKDEHQVSTMNREGAHQDTARKPHRPGTAADTCGTVLACDMHRRDEAPLLPSCLRNIGSRR